MSASDLSRIAAATNTEPSILLGWKGELGLATNREAKIYIVRRESLQRIKAATSIEELRDLFNYGITYGHVVTSDAEEVSVEEWARIEQAAEAKLVQLGGIPTEW